MTKRFVDLSWISLAFDEMADLQAFRDAAERARGIFSAAIAEVQSLGDDAPVADESGIDAELWEHVAPEIRSEDWGKVARGR